MSYNKLFEFSLNRKIDDKTEEVKFFIRKPNRKLYEEAEIFHGSQLNKAIMEYDLIPKALLAKKFAEHKGVYTEEEKKEYIECWNKVKELETEQYQIIVKPNDNRSDKEKNRLVEIQTDLMNYRSKIHKFELQEDNLYEYTAENYARRKVIFWWITHLSYMYDGDKEVQVLGGETHNERLDSYEKLMTEDDADFWKEVISQFTYYIAIWSNAQIGGDEELFREYIKLIEDDKTETPRVEDVKKDIEEKNDDIKEDES